MEIKVCPSTLASGYDTYCPVAVKNLFLGKKVSERMNLALAKDKNAVLSNMRRISVSGVQEKLSAIVDKGRLHLALDGEQSTYILKPAPKYEYLVEPQQIPANEHLTMQIAWQVYKIPVAFNGLCFDAKGKAVYVTRRFDVMPDGSKLLLEDFAMLLCKSEQTGSHNFKYEGCYEDIADSIKRYVPAWPVDLERFYKLVIFNYIYGNGDAHLKNFSLMRFDGDCCLAPAYDLLNTHLHVEDDDFALSGGLLRSGWKSEVYECTGHPCRLDFEEFGRQIGIAPKRIGSIIDEFSIVPQEAKSLISRSFLTPKFQRSYLRIITERTTRFIRTV